MATLTISRPPQQGQVHSYNVQPPVTFPCRVAFFINGGPVPAVGSVIDGLKLVGVGTSGLSFEALTDSPSVEIKAVIHCPGQPDETLVVDGMGHVIVPVPPVPPPGGGVPPGVVFKAVPWPWWRKFLGYCPPHWWSGDERCKHLGELTKVVTLFVNYLECQYQCERSLFTVRFVIVFGVVVSTKVL